MDTAKRPSARRYAAAVRDGLIKGPVQRPVPTYLTHYTDLSGLKGIIESGELWLSNAAFLNDPKELEHGIEQAKKILRNILDDESDWKVEGRCKLIERIMDDLENFECKSVYIACFCSKEDLLSQWRGYSSRQGISISFDVKALNDCFVGFCVEMHNIFYDKIDTEKHMQMEMREEFPDIFDDIEYMCGDGLDDVVRQDFKVLLAKLVPRFKHYGFREEQEWRLIVRDPPIEKLKFRPRGQLMLPYLELKSKHNRLPIKSVTIGPGVNDEAVKKSIRFFLEARGYDPDLVKTSLIPYRT